MISYSGIDFESRMLAAKFYCDETLYSHLAFDFGIDKTTGKSRQKHYIRTSHTKAKEGFILLYTVYSIPWVQPIFIRWLWNLTKWLTCNCEITTSLDEQTKQPIQKRKCDWQFKNKKFNLKHMKEIHCFNSDQKPWNSLRRITSH